MPRRAILFEPSGIRITITGVSDQQLQCTASRWCAEVGRRALLVTLGALVEHCRPIRIWLGRDLISNPGRAANRIFGATGGS